MRTVAVVNHSTESDVAAHLPELVFALQRQANRDFAPAWNTGTTYVIIKKPAATDWQLVLFDDADQAGALGYHDITASGLPLAKVFVKTAKADGASWTVTASHELLEMLADPEINLGAQDSQGLFYAYEVADACEADQYSYLINGISVSDFVLPSWFMSTGKAPFDFQKQIKQPFELLPGGYISVWDGFGWSDLTAEGHKGFGSRHGRRGAVKERSTHE